MTTEEAYQAGIDKLQISYKAVWVDDDRDWIAPDLRTDPAFAWRVWKAICPQHYSALAMTSFRHLSSDTWDDALYVAVCELGKEDS